MKPIRTAIIVFVFWTIVVGGIYPLLMTGIGSRAVPQGRPREAWSQKTEKWSARRCSRRIFPRDVYFHPRPSAAKYDPTNSGASNWGWTSSDLKKAYDQRKSDWQKAYGPAEPPMDMMFASASGLDPDISPTAAEAQVKRVASARQLGTDKEAQLLSLVRSFEEGPQLGFLGEPRVDVLALNLAVDKRFPK